MKKIIWLWLLSVSLILAGCNSSSSTGNTEDVSVNWVDALSVASCLTQKWFKMYWTTRCPHCNNQKEAFWNASDKIPFVDCDKEKLQCAKAWVTWYPTRIWPRWEKIEWNQKVETLSNFAGCVVWSGEVK